MRQRDSHDTRAYKRQLAALIGETIQTARTGGPNRMSEKVLAEKAGIGLSYLRNIEAGRRLPPYFTLHRLAEALGRSLSQLLDEAHQGDPVVQFAAEVEALAERRER